MILLNNIRGSHAVLSVLRVICSAFLDFEESAKKIQQICTLMNREEMSKMTIIFVLRVPYCDDGLSTEYLDFGLSAGYLLAAGVDGESLC